MWRKRPNLSNVPEPPARDERVVAMVLGILPGLVLGLAAVLARRYYLERDRRQGADDRGVIVAGVHSNGHSKVHLGSLDSFS